MRIHAQDGSFLRDLVLPALGSVDHDEGGGVFSGVHGTWAGDEVWLDFTSWVQPASVYHYDYAADRLTRITSLTVASTPPHTIRTRSGTSLPTGRASRCSSSIEGPASRWTPAGPPERVWRLQHLERAALRGAQRCLAEARWRRRLRRTSEAAASTAAPGTRRPSRRDGRTHSTTTIAAARWLVAAGYTTPPRLVLRGNSNGGLLVAVAAMQAPEAFGAVFCRAPNLDMLGFPRHGFGSAAMVEYGSPDDPVEGPTSPDTRRTTT